MTRAEYIRLISKAPDLLVALKKILMLCSGPHTDLEAQFELGRIKSIASEAIKKAEENQ